MQLCCHDCLFSSFTVAKVTPFSCNEQIIPLFLYIEAAFFHWCFSMLSQYLLPHQRYEGMNYAIRRFLVSVVRASRSRGFGIQSPFAYRFVRDVVRNAGKYDTDAEHCRQEGSVRQQRLRRFYARLLCYLNEKGNLGKVVVIEDIHRNRHRYRMWCDVVSDERVGVTFDLYDCGVVFFDQKMYKRNYKVMLW